MSPSSSPRVVIADGNDDSSKLTRTTTTTTLHPQGNHDNNSPSPNNEDENTKIWKARYLLIGAAALYGTNFSLVKILGDTMPEGVSLTLRFSLASLVTLPWLFEGIKQGDVGISDTDTDTESDTDSVELFNASNNNNFNDLYMATWLGFEVGLWNSIGYVAQAVGLETTPASKSAFLCSLAVVVVPLLDFVTGSKRIETRQWIGAILAVIGVAFLELTTTPGTGGATTAAVTTLASHSSSSVTSMPLLSKGDLLSLVQPVAFGIGFWKVEKALHQYPLEARRLTAAQLLAVFCASVCYGLSAIDPTTLHSYPWSEWLTSPKILFSIFWTGVITTALTIYMENKAMETLSASEATVIFATEPIWGTAFAAVVMSEQLGINSAIGAAFILSACFYSNQGMDGISGLAQGVNKNVQIVPRKVQQQWVSFATSVAASWSSWNVAVASAAEDLPDLDVDGLDKILEEVVIGIMKNLPW
mmetsp:Transcript_31364/g.31857  ORF Transcript_31364/g.31857 Transcript_31364/m.31857 type:complete len:473 (+) Transcript_31364:85-1503(+)